MLDSELNNGIATLFYRLLHLRRRLKNMTEEEQTRQTSEIVKLAHRLAKTAEAGVTLRQEVTVHEGYQLWAASYTEERNPLFAAEADHVLKAAGDVKDRAVLDIGCGTGRHVIKHARRHAAQVTGVDNSPEMLAHARQSAAEAGIQVHLVLGDALTLPLSDGTFDIVLCNLVLSHIRDINLVAQEMSRLLTPSGRIIISDYHPFPLLLGDRACCEYNGTTYEIENYTHLISDLFTALTNNGLQVDLIKEIPVNGQLHGYLAYEELEAELGMPFLLLMRAKKPDLSLQDATWGRGSS